MPADTGTTVASFGVGLDLLVGDLTKQLDGFLNRMATRLAGFSGRLSALVSLPLGMLSRQMDEMATQVDLKAREATALLAATFGEDLFTPEAQAQLEQNYRDIIDRSLQLSMKYGEQAVDVVESVFFAIGTGFPTLEDAFRVTEQATIAAAAGATDTATAMNVLLDVMNAYGFAADDARYVSDVLFQTVNIGKVEFEELATSLGDIIGIAPVVGVSLEELGAVIATATKQGQSASLALTGLRQVLINVLAPRAAGAEVLAEIFDTTADRAGIVVQEMIEMEGLLPVLQKIAQEVAVDPVTGRFDPGRAKKVFTRIQGFIRILPLFVKLTDEEAKAIESMNQAIADGADPGQAAEATINELTGAMGRLNTETSMLTESYAAMQVATAGAGATANAFSEIAKSLDRRAKQATASFDAFKIVIGLELKAAILPVLEALGRLVRTFIAMPASTKKMIAMFLLVAIAVPPAILALSLFIGMIANLVAVVGGLISFALSPLVLIIGVLIGTLLKAKLAGEEFQDGMTRAASPLQKFLQLIIALASVAADIFTALARHVSNFVRFVAQAVATIARFFGADITVPDFAEQRRAQEEAAAEAERKRRRGRAVGRGKIERAEGRRAGQDYAEGVAEGVAEAGPEVDRRFADLFPDEDEVENTFTRISRAAIRALLRGMSDVDFDIFADAVGLVDAEVRALGLKGEEAALALQNAQIALAQAISGDVGAWETLRSIIGDSVDLIQEYVQARKAAIAAEEALKAVELFRRQEIARLDAKIAAIREKIRQFELDTAEIPERFTRHRKRQLDEELNAAQKEKEERQRQLDAQVEAARAQAEAAREHAAHLAELLRMEQQLLTEVEDTTDAAEGLEDQFGDIAGAIGAMEAPQGLADIESAFEGLGEKLNTLDLFFKGLMGERLEPDALQALTEEERLAYEQGQNLRAALDEIRDAVVQVIDAFRDLGSTLGNIWSQAPDWLQKVLAGGALAGLLGKALGGVAGLVLRGGQWILGMGINLVTSALSGGITNALASIGIGLGTAAIWALPIALTIVAVKKAIDVKQQIEEGIEQTTGQWSAFMGGIITEAESFDQMIDLIRQKREEVDQIYEEAGPLARAAIDKEELFGDVAEVERALILATENYEDYLRGVVALNEQVSEIPEVEALELLTPEQFATARAEADKATEIVGGVVAGISALTPDAEEASQAVGEALTEPIVVEVQEMSDELVGQSIIPDMVDASVMQFERLNTESMVRLNAFSNAVAVWGNNFLSYWTILWDQIYQYPRQTVDMMVTYVQSALDQITAAVQSMANQTTSAMSQMSNDVVEDSIIPDMVDMMVVEFDRMRAAADASFAGLFGDAVNVAGTGTRGVIDAIGTLQDMPAFQTTAVRVAGVERDGQAGAEFSITNYWDASITEKDRTELAELSRQTTYGALVRAYGGAVREQ